MKHVNVPALAPPSPQPQMLDVAIALLTAARGRNADQVAALIEASQIILGVITPPPASPAATVVDLPPRKPRGGAVQVKKAPKARRAPREPKPVPATPVTARDLAPMLPGASAIELHGVTVSLTAQAESVTFRDQEIEVTTRQAVFVGTLLRGTPHPVAREFIVKKVWIGKVPEFSDQILSVIAGELRAPLATIGLEIKTVRGVGFVLAVPGVEA